MISCIIYSVFKPTNIMNMFKPVKATSIKEYINGIKDDNRRKAIKDLHSFIQESSPSLKPYFANNMLGYGKFKYKNSKGEIIDWPIVALASQKNYISVYVCSIEDGEYIAEKHKDQLGKVSVGKSCIRFNKLEKVDLPELEKVIKKAAKNPGLDGVGANKKKKSGKNK